MELRYIILLVMLVMWALGKLLGGREEEPAAPPQPDEAGGEGGDRKINAEIDEFLRRVTGQEPAEPEMIEPIEPEPVRRLVPARVSQEDLPVGQREVASIGYTQAVAAPSASVDYADERLEQRLSQVFDHGLGQLSSEQSQGQTTTSHTAAFDGPLSAVGMHRLLANPTNVRQAIVLAEILNRPESHR